MKTSQKGFIAPPLLALIAVLVIGAGAYVYVEKKQSNPVSQTSDSSTTLTTGWKTYTNSKYGFEFKYPSNVVAKEYSEGENDEQAAVNLKYGQEEESDRGVTLTMGDVKMNLSIDSTVVTGGAPSKSILEESKTLGQVRVVKSITSGKQISPDGKVTWILSYNFKNQSNDYVFGTFAVGTEGANPIPKSTENLMEQILSTLKFTQATSAQTSDWKTYNNEKFHYSIKYPSDFTLAFEPQSIPVSPNQSSSFNLANFKLDFNTFKGLTTGQIMIKGDVHDNSACAGSIDDPNKQEVTIDGVKAIKYINHASDGGESTSSYGYSFQKDNCFLISLRPYPADKDMLEKFDQILSTFKFTK